MRRNLIRAAVWAGLVLSAGTAPVFANALDSQLQPVATPIPRETVPFDGRDAPGTIVIRLNGRVETDLSANFTSVNQATTTTSGTTTNCNGLRTIGYDGTLVQTEGSFTDSTNSCVWHWWTGFFH